MLPFSAQVSLWSGEAAEGTGGSIAREKLRASEVSISHTLKANQLEERRSAMTPRQAVLHWGSTSSLGAGMLESPNCRDICLLTEARFSAPLTLRSCFHFFSFFSQSKESKNFSAVCQENAELQVPSQDSGNWDSMRLLIILLFFTSVVQRLSKK